VNKSRYILITRWISFTAIVFLSLSLSQNCDGEITMRDDSHKIIIRTYRGTRYAFYAHLSYEGQPIKIIAFSWRVHETKLFTTATSCLWNISAHKIRSLSSLRHQLLEHFIIVANYCQPAKCTIKISTIIIIIIIITTTCLSLSLFSLPSFAFTRKLIIYDFITTEYL